MMTTTKNSKRKNQPNGVDINQFPKLGAAIDEAVASGLLNGVEGAKSLTHMVSRNSGRRLMRLWPRACSTGWRAPRASPIWS